MKQVLFIAYYFPPLGGAGVQRTLKFAKYLHDFGWKPVVLTVQPRQNRLVDYTLLEEIPPDIKVYHTSSIELPSRLPWKLRSNIARWLFLVDEQIGWLPSAVKVGRKLIESTKIDAIYSTSAPYTAHLIGYQLKRATQIPWIADFRDPWVGNFAYQYPTWLHQKLTQGFEEKVILNAERTLVVSEPMREAILLRYAQLSQELVITLTNGFDPADFSGIPVTRENNPVFTITYTGSFYRDVLTPDNFLAALRKVLDDRRIPEQKIRVFMVGNLTQQVSNQVQNLNLAGVVQTIGYVPHRTSIAYLCRSDLLLLIIGTAPGSQAILTGKIFEYLASQKPILALAPPGAAANLIQEAHAGAVVPPEDLNGIADQIYEFYNRWERGLPRVATKPTIIQRYDRKLLTQKLAAIFDEVAE